MTKKSRKNIIINGDYKDTIKEIKKRKILVDAIITDPPYCVSRKHQLGFSNMGRSGMNYGDWDYDFNQKEWIGLCAPIVKEGGSVIVFMDWKNLSYLVEEFTKQGFVIKDLLRWVKKNPMPRNVNSRYVSDFEVAIWAVKGKKKWTFNKPKNMPYIKPIFVSGIVPGGKNRIHPTQKNLEIIEQIVKIHTNKNDLIFDPFMGSGTTIVGCCKNGRKAIGTEIDKNYYAKAKKRIKASDISAELRWE